MIFKLLLGSIKLITMFPPSHFKEIGIGILNKLPWTGLQALTDLRKQVRKGQRPCLGYLLCFSEHIILRRLSFCFSLLTFQKAMKLLPHFPLVKPTYGCRDRQQMPHSRGAHLEPRRLTQNPRGRPHLVCPESMQIQVQD